MNYHQLTQFAPDNWLKQQYRDTIQISISSSEYEHLNQAVQRRSERIERYENIYRYVQFLVRQQHLIAINPHRAFYQVRRFVTLHESQKDKALLYQLDGRRCGKTFEFKKQPELYGGDVIFVVTAVTDQPDNTFTPTRDCDFYIEYIIYL